MLPVQRGAGCAEARPPGATALTPRLQPYLPRLIVEWQETEPEARSWESEGSMVFVDVSGFTKMSERLARQGKVGAEEVSDVIDATFGALLAEAYAVGGSLLKFGGDALLLFFGGVGHELRAVAAAHGMRAELRRIGTFATSAGKVTLRMSVGAHTGLFHFFLVGDSHRELIVAGPAATETVTMEGAATAGQVLLSPALASALPERNRGRRSGPGILLRGAPPPAMAIAAEEVVTELDLTELVPRALRETVLAGDVEPEHRSVTVAFVHFGSFDGLLRREGAEAAAESLERLVRAGQQAVDARGVAFLGTDIAPDGGKIILTAGAPTVTGEDEEQMLLAMRELVDADCGLPLQVGVNRGPVFAGTIGPPYRRTYTVMGDAVNLAARLMARAGEGEVVATPAVLDASRTMFELRALEPFHVKGKRRPITASAVGAARGSRTTIAEAGLPLLGRDRELEQLVEAWEAAREGEGRVVEISAAPGLGKSRLLEEFLARLDGVPVVRAECRLYQAATPYFPFQPLLRTSFELDGLGDADAIAALRRLVGARAPALRPWLALIATPLHLEVEPSPEVEQLEDEFRRARLGDAVAALLAEVATTPTVVVLEDTHWMDEPSRDLLGSVISALGERPWLVVLTRRPGESDVPEGATRIELEPLGLEPAVALIHAATEAAPLRPQQERELAARAAGNPLYLIELLDALRRGEHVATLPGSVDGLIQSRIDTLPVGDRRRLRALSVMGNGFRLEHAVATLDLASGADVRDALRPLGEFLSTAESGWVEFRHALIRDAAYEGLPYRRRQELHARVGDSILRSSDGDPDAQAELLAVHYWHAHRWEEAWRFARVAGDRAREIYANVEAARFYQWALSAAHRIHVDASRGVLDVAVRLAEVREHAGHFEEALATLERARRLAGTDPLALADVRYRRASVLMRTGALRAAYRDARRGQRAVESLPGKAAAVARARLVRLCSQLRLTEGRPRDARELAHAAVREAEAAGNDLETAYAVAVLSDALEDLGEDGADVHAHRALDIYTAIDELPGIGLIENSIGVRAYAEGRWDDAVAAYERSQDAYRRAGNEVHMAATAGNIGEVLVSQGRLDEAEIVLAAAIRVLRAHGLLGPALFASIQLGRVRLALGDPVGAAATVEEAAAGAAELGIRVLSLEAAIVLSDVARYEGDHLRALDLLDEAQAGSGELAQQFAPAIARSRAEVLLALGRRADAARVAGEGLAAAELADAVYERARLLVVSARTGTLPEQERAEALQESHRLLHGLGVIAVPCR